MNNLVIVFWEVVFVNISKIISRTMIDLIQIIKVLRLNSSLGKSSIMFSQIPD